MPKSNYDIGYSDALHKAMLAVKPILDKLSDAKRDSAEWKEQHENLLAMFRESEQKRIAAESAARDMRVRVEGMEKVLKLADELCTAVDNETDDIGGSRPSREIIAELGPAVDAALADAGKK